MNRDCRSTIFLVIKYSLFLAYFLEYAIVRTSSVRPSVYRRFYSPQGCPIGAIYGSIDSLWPKNPNDGRNFFGPFLDPMGGVWSPNSVYFYINIVFYWYLRRVISLMLDREGKGQKWAESKSAPDPKSAPTLKYRYTLWSTYTQWSVKIRLPVTQWRLPSFLLILVIRTVYF